MRHLFAAVLAVFLPLTAIGSAVAFENTIHVLVEPTRLWQCGDGFYPNGGSDTYRMAHVSVDGRALGSFDLAQPAECTKTLEFFTDVPAASVIEVVVEVGGNPMAAAIHTADRNREWTVHFFVDTVWGDLTKDYAEPRQSVSTSSAPVAEVWRNTLRLRVAPGRQSQCGDNFFATGGSETYRYAHLKVDGVAVPDFDFANPADCARIESVARDLPNNGKSTVELTVGPYTMAADITGSARERDWFVNFFVDQIWGEAVETP